MHSTKCSSEMLQNLLYIMYKKTHVVYIKYSKFWSVLLEHFVERKPLISEEWCISTRILHFSFNNRYAINSVKMPHLSSNNIYRNSFGQVFLSTQLNSKILELKYPFLDFSQKSVHYSEIRELWLMKLSSKMLQYLPYFWNKKTQICRFF